jgi:hypothetical protein
MDANPSVQIRAVNVQSAGCCVIRATVRMGSMTASGEVSPPVLALLSRSSMSRPSSSVSLVTQAESVRLVPSWTFE